MYWIWLSNIIAKNLTEAKYSEWQYNIKIYFMFKTITESSKIFEFLRVCSNYNGHYLLPEMGCWTSGIGGEIAQDLHVFEKIDKTTFITNYLESFLKDLYEVHVKNVNTVGILPNIKD